MCNAFVEVSCGIAALVVIWLALQPPDHILDPDDVTSTICEEDVVSVLLVKRRCHGCDGESRQCRAVAATLETVGDAALEGEASEAACMTIEVE